MLLFLRARALCILAPHILGSWYVSFAFQGHAATPFILSTTLYKNHNKKRYRCPQSTWKATTSPKRVPIHRFNTSCKAACFQHKNADNSSFPGASKALLLNLASTKNTDANAEGPRRMCSKPSTCAIIGL